MPFKSVNDILDIVQIYKKCQETPFLRLFSCWEEIVGSAIATHTQPLSIQRNVLWVATSSSVWSQNLTFKRRDLLNKLNKFLTLDLDDIRFSTSGWQHEKNSSQDTKKLLLSQHPSYIASFQKDDPKVANFTKDPKITFASWANTIRMRSRNLPLCDRCQSPTPDGEIQRWGCCRICAAKQM
ncbi:MAG: DciA family protein [Cyanobacteria bacterium P01_A01_bin.84]